MRHELNKLTMERMLSTARTNLSVACGLVGISMLCKGQHGGHSSPAMKCLLVKEHANWKALLNNLWDDSTSFSSWSLDTESSWVVEERLLLTCFAKYRSH